MWPFKRKTSTPTHASFPVGSYRLGMRLNNPQELSEFTSEDYAVFGRNFRGQVNYHAPPVTFLDMTWKLMLGTVNGEIYKLAPYLEFQSKDEADKAASTALSHCSAECADGFAVNVFVTSSAVRSYERL